MGYADLKIQVAVVSAYHIEDLISHSYLEFYCESIAHKWSLPTHSNKYVLLLIYVDPHDKDNKRKSYIYIPQSMAQINRTEIVKYKTRNMSLLAIDQPAEFAYHMINDLYEIMQYGDKSFITKFKFQVKYLTDLAIRLLVTTLVALLSTVVFVKLLINYMIKQKYQNYIIKMYDQYKRNIFGQKPIKSETIDYLYKQINFDEKEKGKEKEKEKGNLFYYKNYADEKSKLNLKIEYREPEDVYIDVDMNTASPLKKWWYIESHCLICLNDVNEGNHFICTFECSHFYHEQCIKYLSLSTDTQQEQVNINLKRNKENKDNSYSTINSNLYKIKKIKKNHVVNYDKINNNDVGLYIDKDSNENYNISNDENAPKCPYCKLLMMRGNQEMSNSSYKSAINTDLNIPEINYEQNANHLYKYRNKNFYEELCDSDNNKIYSDFVNELENNTIEHRKQQYNLKVNSEISKDSDLLDYRFREIKQKNENDKLSLCIIEKNSEQFYTHPGRIRIHDFIEIIKEIRNC